MSILRVPKGSVPDLGYLGKENVRLRQVHKVGTGFITFRSNHKARLFKAFLSWHSVRHLYTILARQSLNGRLITTVSVALTVIG